MHFEYIAQWAIPDPPREFMGTPLSAPSHRVAKNPQTPRKDTGEKRKSGNSGKKREAENKEGENQKDAGISSLTGKLRVSKETTLTKVLCSNSRSRERRGRNVAMGRQPSFHAGENACFYRNVPSPPGRVHISSHVQYFTGTPAQATLPFLLPPCRGQVWRTGVLYCEGESLDFGLPLSGLTSLSPQKEEGESFFFPFLAACPELCAKSGADYTNTCLLPPTFPPKNLSWYLLLTLEFFPSLSTQRPPPRWSPAAADAASETSAAAAAAASPADLSRVLPNRHRLLPRSEASKIRMNGAAEGEGGEGEEEEEGDVSDSSDAAPWPPSADAPPTSGSAAGSTP